MCPLDAYGSGISSVYCSVDITEVSLFQFPVCGGLAIDVVVNPLPCLDSLCHVRPTYLLPLIRRISGHSTTLHRPIDVIKSSSTIIAQRRLVIRWRTINPHVGSIKDTSQYTVVVCVR